MIYRLFPLNYKSRAWLSAMILLEFFLPNLYLFQTVSVKYMTKKFESEMNFSSLRFSHLHVYMIELTFLPIRTLPPVPSPPNLLPYGLLVPLFSPPTVHFLLNTETMTPQLKVLQCWPMALSNRNSGAATLNHMAPAYYLFVPHTSDDLAFLMSCDQEHSSLVSLEWRLKSVNHQAWSTFRRFCWEQRQQAQHNSGPHTMLVIST